MLDVGRVEDAVEAVEPAVGSPGERVGQLVRVVAAEAGDDDLALVGLAVAVGVLQEENVGRVGDPHAAVADGDARGNVQSVGEDGELVDLAVAVGVFQDLDAVAARPGRVPRIFEALGDPDPAPLVERHGDRIDDVGLGRDQLDVKASGTFILAIASAGDSAGPGGWSWPCGIGPLVVATSGLAAVDRAAGVC